MPARDQQQQVRKTEVGIDQAWRERVAFQVVDGDQRLAGRKRQAMAGKSSLARANTRSRTASGLTGAYWQKAATMASNE